MLDRLAEIGMEIAEALGRQIVAQAAEPQAAPATDLALAFTRVARAVRQTLALKPRLAEDQRMTDLQDRQRAAHAARKRRGKAAVERAVEHAIAADCQAEDGTETDETLHDAERLRVELRERLDDADIDAELSSGSIGDIIAGICADLGIAPDWDACRNEAWFIAETEASEADEAPDEEPDRPDEPAPAPAPASPPARRGFPITSSYGYQPWTRPDAVGPGPPVDGDG
jgi:hypothetical protein